VIALAAALSASIAIGAPVTVGQVANPGETLGPSAQVDPTSGGWIQFTAAAGRQLARVSESGRVMPVSLPSQLGGEARSTTLQLTPLKSGWVVAVNTVFPGDKAEQARCLEESVPPLTVDSSPLPSARPPVIGRRCSGCLARAASK
jgi:hypothetical protein